MTRRRSRIRRALLASAVASAATALAVGIWVASPLPDEVVARVPAAAFEPAPKVDSAVLRLSRRVDPPIPAGPRREPFYRIVQAGFRQRRKQIHNGLGRELPLPPGALAGALAACDVDPERRPQTLSVDEWACLAGILAPVLDDDRRGRPRA